MSGTCSTHRREHKYIQIWGENFSKEATWKTEAQMVEYR